MIIKEQMVGLHVCNRLRFFEIQKIVRLKALNNYAEIYFSDKTKKISCHTLAWCERKLAGFDFFRAHKSHLINPQYVVERIKGSHIIIMRDHALVPLARRRRKQFRKVCNTL